jgi:TRAP-type C4-dicarboxylate transport system permease small subunit
MLVWISFLGATTAYYRGVHPGVDVVVQKLTKHIQWFCKLLVHFLSMLLFLAITIAGLQFAYFIRMQISPALGINKWLILSIIPISSTILIVYAVTFFLATLKGMKNGQ